MRQFDYAQVKNPEFFKENRMDAHSDHVWYRSMEEKEKGESSFRVSLNGLWKFSYAVNYESAVKGFEALEYDCRGWADIRVPAHIQLEGYDSPQYVNIQYPWDGREQIEPGEIPERFNPVASYAKYFYVPEGWGENPVYISFQGVESAFALWCNGSYVGYSEDSFTPSEFDLTPFLREEENKLAVQVFKWCSSSWCEDQDFFRFSGIFREVYLYTVPKTHLWDLKVQTLLEEGLEKAELVLDMKLAGEGKVRAVLWQEEKPEGFKEAWQNPLNLGSCKKEVADWEASIKEENHFVIPVEKPLLWSAEEPNLYQLIIEVQDEKGKVTEIIPQLVGFRRFELKDGLMKLNGNRIVFKGVNRHEFSSHTGRVVSREELWQDLITMKQNNINGIRTCHYPNMSEIYVLCDRLGLYMIDECNLESHGSWEPVERGIAGRDRIVPGSNPKWNEMMLDRANSMYQRDKNHPAILIWSCGNEAFGGKNIYDMSAFFRSQDRGRLVHYEGLFHDRSYPETSDMESQMYPSVADIEKFLKENRSKPFICCEYTHAMGNSCGAMHKYTDLTDREPLYQGGFIWDYIDQSLDKRNRYGEEYQAYGGDFDDRPTDYNFSGNGIVYGGDRMPSPKMQEVKYNYQSITVEILQDRFIVQNKNLFVDTGAFDCVVLLEQEGKQIRKAGVTTDVKPGCSGEFMLPFKVPEKAEAATEYAVTVSFRLKKEAFWAEAGHEIAFGQRVWQVQGTTSGKCGGAGASEKSLVQGRKLSVSRGTHNLGVRGADFEVLFSYGAGGMVSYRYGGKELLKTVPKPNFWRAPVDNDCGNDMMQRYGQWKLASLYATTKGVKGENPRIEEGAEQVRLTYTYLLPTRPAGQCEVGYLVTGDGTVQISLLYDWIEELGDMPEFGMLLKLDADYENLEWYGNGPAETYADRKKGAKLGIYRNKVADNMAKYLVPQECGNKTEVRYAKLTDKRGRGLLFTADTMSFSALPYTPHELENAAHAFELPPVHYTVVRAALGQMGVGGDDSWQAKVHPEYLIQPEKQLKFSFGFRGI